MTLDTPNFLWPNFAKVVPESVFNQRVIVVPDGFLPPGKNNGGIYLTLLDSSDITKTVKTVTITHNKSGYFYHMGFWMDLNGDGRMDFLTAKSNAKAVKANSSGTSILRKGLMQVNTGPSISSQVVQTLSLTQ